jgi:putative membrane protein
MSDPQSALAAPGMSHAAPPRSPLPVYLFAFYAVFWAVMAISPRDRFDWLLENLLVFLGVGWLIWAYRKRPLSNASYLLITAFFCLHTIGAHYTYSETPIGYWIANLLGIERNHYDRVVHFSFGLLMCYPLHEHIMREAQPRGDWSLAFAVLFVASASLTYELIEWIVAVVVDKDAAMAFLGTQGDVFDAHKDSALAVLGALIAALVARFARKKQRHRTAKRQVA